MSRKVRIAHFVAGGVEYGRVVQPSEHMDMQHYAHRHVELVTRDKLTGGGAVEVSGFDYALPGGMNFSVGEGHALDGDGLSYHTFPEGEASVVAIPAAHPAQPRIDLVVATLQAEVETENGPLAHRRLRTTLELQAGADPYPIENQNVATEIQNRATIQVIQGVAGVAPVAPAAGAGQVALYRVRVEAAAGAITADKVTDVRNLMRSLHDALTELDTLSASPAIADLGAALNDRVAVAGTLQKNYAGGILTLSSPPVDLSTRVAKAGDTMTGQLILPANGLVIGGPGGTQLVAAGGKIGLGIAAPETALHLYGQQNFVPVAIIHGVGASEGIQVKTDASNVKLAEFISNGNQLMLLHGGPGTSTVVISKIVNDKYGLEIANGGDRGHGLYVHTGASGAEPLALFHSILGDALKIQANGKVGVGTNNPVLSGVGKLHVAGDVIRLDTPRTPGAASSGNPGEFCWDAGFLYICVSANTWKRVALVAY
jgi:hypothetical protein